MDTDAIYHSVCAYGAAKAARCTFDAWDHIDAVKRLLNEADAERQELLATNERLVDEVAELKAKLTDKASLLRGCYARINGLEKDAARLDWLDSNLFAREPDEWDRKYGSCKDGIAWCWVLFAPKGAQGSARSIIDAALEKKHEGT